MNSIKIKNSFIKFVKIHHRVILKLLNLRLSFCLPSKPKTNYYIGLGTNCYARYIPVRIGIKSKKKAGELSYPFDLCVTSVNNIAQILENNFEDYVENIIESPLMDNDNRPYIYRNKKYDINYIHDNDIDSLEKIKKRYEKRIENFITISENQEEVVYLMFVFLNEFTPIDLNSIYSSLEKYRNSKPFKFAVFSFTGTFTNIKEKLNPNIIYNEYIPHCGAATYKSNWHSYNSFFEEPIIKDVCKDICNL